MALLSSLRHHLDRLASAFKHRGLLSQSDINQHLRELRRALLEEEVALTVVKDLIERLSHEALPEILNAAAAPGIKLLDMIQSALTAMLDLPGRSLDLKNFPSLIMMVGLQGSGKTTTTAKLASYHRDKKTLMVSLDIYRPAAIEQLTSLGNQIGVDVMICQAQQPLARAHEALEKAKAQGYELLLLDTAGRRSIDTPMMDELAKLSTDLRPQETLLVVDSLMGQGALAMADQFQASIPLTGIILTRLDAEGPCGAALSVTATTRVPIKFIGTGEHLHDFELFDPTRLISGLMGHGDMIGLVDKLSETLTLQAPTEPVPPPSGPFELKDYRDSLNKLSSMGGLGALVKYLPSSLTSGLPSGTEEGLKSELALLNSMTRQELEDHRLLTFSRKQRILKGSGRKNYELNRLIKKFLTLRTMMKKALQHGLSTPKNGEKRSLRNLPSALKSLFSLDESKKQP